MVLKNLVKLFAIPVLLLTSFLPVSRFGQDTIVVKKRGQASVASAPVLKRMYLHTGATSNTADRGDAFKIYLDTAGPRAVVAGDVVAVVIANHSTRTYTVSDDQTSTWTVGTGTCTANTLKYSIVYASAAGPMSIITLTAGANDSNITVKVYVISGLATSSIADGNDCKTGQTGPTVSANPFSTTVDGDFVLQQIFDQNNPMGIGSANTGVTWGSSWTGLDDEIYFGAASQYIIQSTHGSITPSLTFAQAAHDTFTSVSIAFKPGSGGSSPGTGIGIRAMHHVPIDSAGAASTTVVVPTDTTQTIVAMVVINEASTNGSSLTGVSYNGQSFTAISCNATCVSDATPQMFIHCNITPTNTGVLTLTLTITANDLIGVYEIPGAKSGSATSCLDTAAAAANSSALTNTSSGATFRLTTSTTTMSDAPSITPSTANGLVLGAGNIGTGPASKCASTCTFDFVGATWSVGGDNNFFSNGDFASHVYNSSAAVQNFSYSSINNGSSAGSGAVALLKQ